MQNFKEMCAEEETVGPVSIGRYCNIFVTVIVSQNIAVIRYIVNIIMKHSIYFKKLQNMIIGYLNHFTASIHYCSL